MWGYQGSVGLVGGSDAEIGRTIPHALSGGAALHSGTVALRGVATGARRFGYLYLHWHKHKTAPTSFPASPNPGNFLGRKLIHHAGEIRGELPQDCLDAIENGTFGGFSIRPRGSEQSYFSAAASTGASGPILRLRYTR